MCGTIIVKLYSYRVNASLKVIHSPFFPRNSSSTQTIESRIERKHDNFYPTAFGSSQSNFSIVTAYTYVFDFSFFFQLEYIVKKRAAL